MYSNVDELVERYLELILQFQGLRKGLAPILRVLLTYKQKVGTDWVLYINRGIKESVCDTLGLGMDSINKAVYELNQASIIERIASGTYRVDEYLVIHGCNVANIQVTFDLQENAISTKFLIEGDPSSRAVQHTTTSNIV